ncbi:hypothetical protein GGR50DRAFT_636152 [Xylaria sp. CBS 124048]|nr:hypothetical protein GGR50DRAFT_636152 [Xylaria sp. CBS 124048]
MSLFQSSHLLCLAYRSAALPQDRYKLLLLLQYNNRLGTILNTHSLGRLTIPPLRSMNIMLTNARLFDQIRRLRHYLTILLNVPGVSTFHIPSCPLVSNYRPNAIFGSLVLFYFFIFIFIFFCNNYSIRNLCCSRCVIPVSQVWTVESCCCSGQKGCVYVHGRLA